ncbi:asparaginase [Clostridium botulinum]|uniref:Asparaginase n=1 Tax=Clostridium botulinum TaxID=1491 RepID=A0A0L9Y8I9_CLOBO|nr:MULTISPECIES: asparaginase [Clostridium]ACD53938.1 L-asparaginase, type II [Clostridium botulinum E3 str. Alaska E43]AJF29169.1 asparaginase [Clostridium botulinum]AJF32230.1 asparaginase [Clostridium botulinum]EES50048.1 L-asparaginase, type II [Clostridium botulinum E1 str. 'BoNT E Beluga']KAI3350899.1 asparaginase [Clostridium botulinum]
MKKIAIIFNGGTISMKVDEKIKAAVPSLSGEEIMQMVTGIQGFAEIESHTFSNLPSPHMTSQLMLELSNLVQKLLDRDDISGVVITHGTDTLEETAYFLDLTLNSDKPVVVTGAMRSSDELGYDGPFNLATSICTAISDSAKNRGVLVCFNSELHSAKEVTKRNSMALNAFSTPNFGPIGIVDNNRVIFYRENSKSTHVKINSTEKDVALIKCVSGMDSKFIDFVIDNGYKGVVIEALGRGNVPPLMVEGIKRAIKKGIPVVMVSRCFEGRVFESYGYLGGGKNLREYGVIFGDVLSGQKARIKLLVAVNHKDNLMKIREIFEKDTYEI